MSKFKPSRGALAGPGDYVSKRDSRERTAWEESSPSTSGKFHDTAVITAPELEASGSGVQLPAVEPPNPTQQIALRITLAFLYFRFSFVHEFISSTIHMDTHIMIILGVLSYVGWFLSGGIFTAFKDRLAWIWTGFVFWMVMATITSVWRGQSLTLVLLYIRTVYPLMLLIPAVTSSVDDLKRVINVIGIAGTTTVLFGLVHRDFSQGRMDINTDGSSIQDPNDFAAHILAVLPAIAYLMFAKNRPIVVKLFGAGIFAAALLEMMSTGSRGGFVALVATVVYVIFTGSPKLRMSLLVGLPTLGLLALPFVPQKSMDRIKSLVISSDADKSATESADARRALLLASLQVTAQRPITGVGPGQFADYQAGMAREVHQKGMWHETHNGYTQISSECGIPAALLYLSAVYLTFKSLFKASKSNIPGLPSVARTLATMAVAFSSSLVFLAQAYRFTMLVIGAITIAVNQVVARYERTAQ